MSLIKEFKEFAMKGNIIDLAVAVIIGAAFGKIVSSFVNDILMPPIGLMLGGVDFTDLVIVLKEGVEGVDPVTLNYGMFLQTVIDFLIVAFSIFMVIKVYQRMQKKEEAAPVPPAPPTLQESLLAEIRDLLKEDRNKSIPPLV
ncbi:large-conductance mechanosensitive channel protein MscL [Catalinimonas niigatensis]|uniref:large-conductance mechanosensitive channel protein MscL n=1 Tax=Catalinimonas niigatensis TaxID=1397264 RepID=UPI002666802B|nr:large-conductance mechanosensitive channel protein MscL [Catalinimonas niigatensis]WPP52882.1 large-conductance mechanosensitive channel protein MscL [Catalinimonas niigatensis]